VKQIMKDEVIAVLLSEGEPRSSSATLLMRNADGQMSLRTVNPDSPFGRHAMRTGCFRRGKPIIDPVSRQMIGYEMEMVPNFLSTTA
jgi:hypothetical protein